MYGLVVKTSFGVLKLLVLCLPTSGDILFLPWSFVRPSVRLFVCLSVCPSQNRVRSVS